MARHPRAKASRRRTPRLKGLSFNRIIPNLMTLLALCAGLTSLRYGLHGEYEKAVVAIILAGILDGLDGRVARLLKGTSRFGAELDSLSDFVCFGVAPALLLYLWSMGVAGGVGWALVLLYVVSCGLRLARFNTQLMGERDLPAWAYNYFTGVPAPAGAGLVLLPMMLSFATDSPDVFSHPALVGLVLSGVAVLMISRVPTFSFKNIKVPHAAVLPIMVGIGILAGFLVTSPWLTLAGVGCLYLGMMPVSLHSFRRLEREAQAMTGETPDGGASPPGATPPGATPPGAAPPASSS
ncbi:CDP-alcohol phosphatidyltransferase family protein [Pararhodospirillum oryzae]|uniref:CDP-diacylglycerol--serine O-phosphatidyltransferase n=1 Tax=Pararhodospirillum oryzae TaxID=478448 RepID=A0A512H4G9_9PROT|nr:phosphatidylcholine/phosphatidylserine synthase [Pararhodospirillum oryzae]GEO80333.1 CDP-diacylglycerol--serine O-phosphatidyltransferase [Pararhodospirillum oryzae]